MSIKSFVTNMHRNQGTCLLAVVVLLAVITTNLWKHPETMVNNLTEQENDEPTQFTLLSALQSATYFDYLRFIDNHKLIVDKDQRDIDYYLENRIETSYIKNNT